MTGSVTGPGSGAATVQLVKVAVLASEACPLVLQAPVAHLRMTGRREEQGEDGGGLFAGRLAGWLTAVEVYSLGRGGHCLGRHQTATQTLPPAI